MSPSFTRVGSWLPLIGVGPPSVGLAVLRVGGPAPGVSAGVTWCDGGPAPVGAGRAHRDPGLGHGLVVRARMRRIAAHDLPRARVANPVLSGSPSSMGHRPRLRGARPASVRTRPRRTHRRLTSRPTSPLEAASATDVKIVRLMLGRKTTTLTLDLYGHLFPDRLDELADRFDDAVCAPDVNHEATGEVGEGDQ